MKHVSFSPLEYKIIEDGTPGSPLGQIELVGDRSEHIVVGRVNRLFEHDPEHSGFPIYVEELQQEILIQELDIPDLKVGDALQIKGRLCGEVYEISR
ncbi:hypothetical protein D3C81_1688400 [compost metagenome]